MIETLKPFGVGQYHNAIGLIALADLRAGALFTAFLTAFLTALLATFLAAFLDARVVFALPLLDPFLDWTFHLVARAMVSLPSAALLPKFVSEDAARSHKLRKRATQNTEGVGET
jgi:membrane protein implicated in regulation of membrane protease activity